MQKRLLRKLDMIVSGFVFAFAIGLVLFMIVQTVAGVFEFGHSVALLLVKNNMQTFTEISSQILGIVATVVVLVKAYRILVSYAYKHHIGIKYLVEITIIATTLELLFRIENYSLENKIIFVILDIVGLAAYLLYFKDKPEDELADIADKDSV